MPILTDNQAHSALIDHARRLRAEAWKASSVRSATALHAAADACDRLAAALLVAMVLAGEDD